MVALSFVQTAVRAVQGLTALGAMIFISLGYVEYTSGQLSSGAAIFSTVANYTALLSSTYYVLGLRWLQLSSTPPRPTFQRLLDGGIAAALALAGVLHMTSDAKQDCTSQNILFSTYHGRNLFRCGNMTFGIILTFVTAALFVVTTASSFVHKAAPMSDETAPSEYATAQTPVAKDNSVPSTAVYRPGLRALRLGGRAVQFACATAALVFTVAGYKHYYTGQYVSPKATFAILMAYTCAAYSLWHLVVVEHFKLARRPALRMERIGDGVLAFGLLVAGVVVATSSHVTNCDERNAGFVTNHKTTLFRCGSMNSGVVFTLLAVAAYGLTIVASFMSGAVQEHGGRETTMTIDADNHA